MCSWWHINGTHFESATKNTRFWEGSWTPLRHSKKLCHLFIFGFDRIMHKLKLHRTVCLKYCLTEAKTNDKMLSSSKIVSYFWQFALHFLMMWPLSCPAASFFFFFSEKVETLFLTVSPLLEFNRIELNILSKMCNVQKCKVHFLGLKSWSKYSKNPPFRFCTGLLLSRRTEMNNYNHTAHPGLERTKQIVWVTSAGAVRLQHGQVLSLVWMWGRSS